MQVVLREGESFENLLRRFKSAVEHNGIIKDYKKHQVFMTRSERARAKAKRAQRRQARKLRRVA